MDKKNVVRKRDVPKEAKENVIVPVSPKKKDDHIIINGKKYLHEPDEEFESCCFKCDKPLCLYIGKYTISLLVLVFCFFMLQNKDNSAEFYTGTIAGLLGHYLNSPIAQLSGKKDKDKKD
tara:strand:+ start:556 stop:915 length:360 start_codon:yes stop_codon:yes gene_type:complete